jgi:hypothetical protein
MIRKDLFEDVPVLPGFDDHQVAPSKGIGICRMFRVKGLYHISPSPSTPHRPSPGDAHLPR